MRKSSSESLKRLTLTQKQLFHINTVNDFLLDSMWLLFYVRFLLICYASVIRMKTATCLLACLYQSKVIDLTGFMGGFHRSILIY